MALQQQTKSSQCDALFRPFHIQSWPMTLPVSNSLFSFLSNRQSTPIAIPAIYGQNLSPPPLLLASILGHPASHLSKSRLHDFSEVSL